VAIIAILQHQSSLSACLLNSHLSFALNSRVIIEQAKGMTLQSAGSNTDESFGRLRSHARNHNLRVTDVAGRVVERTVDVVTLDFR
jgi:AmiR/NasT family two-component response regulator